MIETVKLLKTKKIFDTMIPYIKASTYILDNLMVRGNTSDDYRGNDIIHEVLKKIDLNNNFEDKNIINELLYFINNNRTVDSNNKLIVWNNLSKETRQAFYKLVYGVNSNDGEPNFNL